MDCVICKVEMFHQKEDIHWCSSCGLYSSDIPPDTSLYDKSYCVKYQRYERTGFNEKLQEIRHRAVKYYAKNGRLLDFGCGSGAFINYANQNGFVARGFDINPYSGFTDIGVLFGQYDVVTFWDVLEHLQDPLAVILGLKTKFVFACTPNAVFGDIRNIFNWHHYYPGEHVHYFNKKSLEALFKAAGYKVIHQSFDESDVRRSAGSTGILTMGGELYGQD